MESMHMVKFKGYRSGLAVIAALGLTTGLVTASNGSAATKVDPTWNCVPSKSKPANISLIEYFAGPARTPLLNAFARQYEQNHPGVKINIISPSQADAPAKITQLLQAGAVDIVEPGGNIQGNAVSAKQLANIYPYISKSKSWAGLTDYSQFQAQAFGKNVIYVMPNGYYTKAAFIRTQPFKDAGLPLPKTWDDILNASSKINTSSSWVYAMRGAKASFTQAIFIIRAYNAPDLNLGGYFNKSTGKSMFENPLSQVALDKLMQIWHKASPPAAVSWGYPEMVQGFVNGTANYLIQDNEVIQIVSDGFAPFGQGWTLAQMPKGPTGYSAQDVSGTGWSVTQASKCKNVAAGFIDFLSSDPQASIFARAYGVGPITKTASKDPFFKTGAWSIYNTIGQDPKELKLNGEDVNQACYGAFFTQADKDMQAMYAGTLSTSDALKSWASYWNTSCTNTSKS